jgi:hypothetical protein
VIVALWEVSAPPYSWRWSAVVSDCNKPFGIIRVVETGNQPSSWSVEGSRAYDHIAVQTCLAYYMGQQK